MNLPNRRPVLLMATLIIKEFYAMLYKYGEKNLPKLILRNLKGGQNSLLKRTVGSVVATLAAIELEEGKVQRGPGPFLCR